MLTWTTSPGDQHCESRATTNPFIVPTPHVSEYTAQQIDIIQHRLDQQLGPEYISTRPGNGGGKVHYLAAEKVINLANEVFGFNGWSSSIQNMQVDFVDENTENGRVNLGLSTVVRVTLRDGTFHEDIGYGHCENAKGKAVAFEKAKKEAATDALKRALRNFGNVLGNCLYDKDYLQKVTKVKVPPATWDTEKLHRHPSYAIKREPVLKETPQQAHGSTVRRNASGHSAHSIASFASAEFEDDFLGLDDADFVNPDEGRLDDSIGHGNGSPTKRAMSGQLHTAVPHAPSNLASVQTAPARPPLPQQTSASNRHNPQRVQTPQLSGYTGQAMPRMPPPPMPTDMQRPQANSHHQSKADGTIPTSGPASVSNSSTGLDQQAPPLPRDVPDGVPAGFVTGRKADVLVNLSDTRSIDASLAFNPHAESPSIRRTQGVNPGKSAPVSRQQVTSTANHPSANPHLPTTALANSVQSARPPGPNFVNPASDMNRRIGMPSPAVGRPSPQGAPYRPPTTAKRPVMADVTNLPHTDGGPDAKKAKVEPTNAKYDPAPVTS